MNSSITVPSAVTLQNWITSKWINEFDQHLLQEQGISAGVIQDQEEKVGFVFYQNRIHRIIIPNFDYPINEQDWQRIAYKTAIMLAKKNFLKEDFQGARVNQTSISSPDQSHSVQHIQGNEAPTSIVENQDRQNKIYQTKVDFQQLLSHLKDIHERDEETTTLTLKRKKKTSESQLEMGAENEREEAELKNSLSSASPIPQKRWEARELNSRFGISGLMASPLISLPKPTQTSKRLSQEQTPKKTKLKKPQTHPGILFDEGMQPHFWKPFTGLDKRPKSASNVRVDSPRKSLKESNFRSPLMKANDPRLSRFGPFNGDTQFFDCPF